MRTDSSYVLSYVDIQSGGGVIYIAMIENDSSSTKTISSQAYLVVEVDECCEHAWS